LDARVRGQPRSVRSKPVDGAAHAERTAIEHVRVHHRRADVHVIEVKTTGLGKYFPFNVTVNEVRCSEARPAEFQLYRVFNFGPDARLYMLSGAISGSRHLDATQYRAFVQGSGQRLSNG
jgi:Protein NO VEIN, C-terminal